MDKKTFESVLKDAGKLKDGAYLLGDGDGQGLLLSAGSSMVTLEQVKRVELRAGYLVAETQKKERYYLDLSLVMGLKVGAPPSEGAGFV